MGQVHLYLDLKRPFLYHIEANKVSPYIDLARYQANKANTGLLKGIYYALTLYKGPLAPETHSYHQDE